MPNTAKVLPLSEQVPQKLYAKFLEDLIFDTEIPEAGKRIGCKIAKGYVVKWGYCAYSMKQLAQYTNVSERHVNSMIKLLEKRGYIEVNRDNLRNRYIPNFWPYENEPAREKPKSENRSTNCTPVHERHMNSSSVHTIEEDSDSTTVESFSSQPKENTNKPKAFLRETCAESNEAKPKFPIVGKKIVIRTWRDMEKHVLLHQRRYTANTGKWDRKCFEESVKRATRRFAQDSGFKFPCFKLAFAKYTGWLKIEQIKVDWFGKHQDDFEAYGDYD